MKESIKINILCICIMAVIVFGYTTIRLGHISSIRQMLIKISDRFVGPAEAQCPPVMSCTWSEWFCACSDNTSGSDEGSATLCVKCENGIIADMVVAERPYTEVENNGNHRCPAGAPNTGHLGGKPGAVTIYHPG